MLINFLQVYLKKKKLFFFYIALHSEIVSVSGFYLPEVSNIILTKRPSGLAGNEA